VGAAGAPRLQFGISPSTRPCRFLFPELPLGSRRRGGIKAMALRVVLVGGSAVISDASLIPRCNCSCGGSLQGVLWRGPHRHPPSGVECTQSQKLSKLKLEIQVGGIVASCRSCVWPPAGAVLGHRRAPPPRRSGLSLFSLFREWRPAVAGANGDGGFCYCVTSGWWLGRRMRPLPNQKWAM
jgi:hypothetical protein